MNSKQRTSLFLILDCTMMLLIICNLSWIFFDSLFESQSVRDLVKWFSPAFYEAYKPIHNDFLRYDMIFVTIYLVEFGARWVNDLYHKRSKHWYYFPFIHWYDLLGCIPIGAFHFLRVLRIVIILRKLQDLGLVNWQDTGLYKFYRKYSGIITEEISDRVVAQVLDGMTAELQKGSPVLHQIIGKAVVPRTQPIGEWLSMSMTQLIHHSYDSRKSEIHHEIRAVVRKAAEDNIELKKIIRMPLFGSYAGDVLERIIADMIFDITNHVVDYLRSDLSTDVISESLSAVLATLADPDGGANDLVQSILLDTIDVIKQQVQIQQWKTAYD